MKRVKALFFTITLMSGMLFAENIDIDVIKLHNQSQLSWSITNSAGHTEFSSKDFVPTDTFMMELEAEQHFNFNINIDSINPQDTNLLLLQVNNAPIMLIKSKLEKGEFSYPFFSGIKDPVLKIVGGTTVSIEDFPWQIYFRSGDYMCGGSIISEKWILTAAHCTQDENNRAISASDMKVKVGTSTPYTAGSGKWYQVKSYTINSNYNTNNYTYDIAVLELEEEIDFENAEAIDLISSNDVSNGATDPGVMSTVTGWGLTQVDPDDYPDYLQKVQLPIISEETAEGVWGSYVKSSFIFAGYKNGNKDACSGDSGGPLVVDVDGVTKLAGIVSWGSTECNTYGAFTRVSDYLDWIEDQTGITSNVSLTKPQGDEEVCYGTSVSTYQTSSATTGTYEWSLVPDSAGSLTFNDSIVNIAWDSNFIGSAHLSVRAVIDGDTTSWKTTDIAIEKNTVVYSYSGDTTICEDGAFYLEVDADGHNLSYQWYKDSAIYATSSVGHLYIVASDTTRTGEYYCVVSGSCGDIATGSVYATVYPTTTITDISDDQKVGQKDSVRLNVTSIGHDCNYQWFKDDKAIDGATMNYLDLLNVNATTIGLYNVAVSGDCLNDTSDYIYVYVDNDSSVNSTEEERCRIWPSIFNSYLYTAISNNSRYDINIYDINGRLIFKQNNATNQNYINTSGWCQGIYVVEILSQDVSGTCKVIKK